jgi:hypothetical protein
MAKKKAPRGPNVTTSHVVSLDEFVVQSQKCLARAVESAMEAAKAEVSFSEGDRPMYVVDGLTFDLSAGISSEPGKTVRLDFESREKERSRLTFRVERKPIEVASEPQLILSNLDPLGTLRPNLQLRINYFDRGEPKRGRQVRLNVAESGDSAASNHFDLETDYLGRVEIHVNLDTSVLRVLGDSVPRRLEGLRFEGECFFWVEDVEAQKQSEYLILPISRYVSRPPQGGKAPASHESQA